MQDKLKQLIDDSSRVLITSHTSPDPDAVSSLLLLGTTLRLNFSDKQIEMVLEEQPDGLDFLIDYDKIQFKLLLDASKELKPDLFIIVDANNYERVCRHDSAELRDYLKQSSTKLAIVDHHLPDDKDEADVFINSGSLAAVQEVYETCFDHMDLRKPEDYAQTTMVGLYSDSGGFAYSNLRQQDTFKLAGELVATGANVELIKNKLNQYSDEQLKVLSELANNLTHDHDYSYTFINDTFVKDWLEAGRPLIGLQSVRKRFVNEYLRNVGGRQWGFVVSLDPEEGDGCYSASFRAVNGLKDVSKIAQKFGGGGHKAASGADLKAANVQEAIEKIKTAIAQTD